jgi:hypothetical protein
MRRAACMVPRISPSAARTGAASAVPWRCSHQRSFPPTGARPFSSGSNVSGGWAGRRVYSREFHRNKNLVRRRSGGRCEVLGDRPELPWAQRLPSWPRCARPARSVDHIIPQWRGGGDGLLDLQDICDHHHGKKTQAEAQAAKALRSTRRPPMPPPGLRKGKPMKVQFTTPTAGRELNEVADLPDHEAEFLLAQGAVRKPGEDQPAQGVAEGNPNVVVVHDGEVHRNVPQRGEQERQVDLGERANAQSGKGDQPIPTDVLERNPFEDEGDSESGLEGMSNRELKSYIERINDDNPDANLQVSGSKHELVARIRAYEADNQ